MFLYLPNNPDSAKWLSREEKVEMMERRKREYGYTKSAEKLKRADVKKAFKDWKVWVFAVAQFGVDTMLYGKAKSGCRI